LSIGTAAEFDASGSADDKVSKSGDTMTGTLTVPDAGLVIQAVGSGTGGRFFLGPSGSINSSLTFDTFGNDFQVYEGGGSF
jgi:hypothetical protein